MALMEAKRAENMILHKDEIKSRAPRKWIETPQVSLPPLVHPQPLQAAPSIRLQAVCCHSLHLANSLGVCRRRPSRPS